MKAATQNWLILVDKELKLAELALNGNEPLGVIYHLHASAEKALKAIYEETKGMPPKIHRLNKLAIDCCGIKLKEKEKDLFELLDKAFIDSRYPKDITVFENEYNINSCKKLIKETKDTIKWLKSLMNNN